MSLSPALHPPSPTICLCPVSPPPRRHPAPSPPRISEIGALHTPGPWGSRPVHGKSMHCGLLEEPDMDSTGKCPPQAAGSFPPSGRTFQLDRGGGGSAGGSGGSRPPHRPRRQMSPGVRGGAGCGAAEGELSLPGWRSPTVPLADTMEQRVWGFFGFFFFLKFFSPFIHHRLPANKLIASPLLVLGAHFS